MTNSELRDKLEQAQRLLAEVYGWASLPMSNGLQVTPTVTNAEIAHAMSVADGCICDALWELDGDGE